MKKLVVSESEEEKDNLIKQICGKSDRKSELVEILARLDEESGQEEAQKLENILHEIVALGGSNLEKNTHSITSISYIEDLWWVTSLDSSLQRIKLI